MRINLVTPFADKDKAKALGARWDASRKVWYIVDVADLTPFMRWIPDMDAATGSPGMASGSVAPKAPVITQSGKEVAGCGCKVLPWDDCDHTIVRG